MASYEVSSGVVSSGVILNNTDYMVVNFSGTAVDTTVNSGGELYVSNGGTANRITVNSNGRMFVSSGGTALDIAWTPGVGYIYFAADATVTFTSDYNGVYVASNNAVVSSSAVIEEPLTSGYSAFVMNGGKLENTAIEEDGWADVWSGGMATAAMVNSGGRMVVENSGTADSITVNSDGLMYVCGNGMATGTTVSSGGSLNVYGKGTVTGTTVSFGGKVNVYDRGMATGTTVNSGGIMHIEYEGIANSTTVNSGGWLVVSYGKLTGILEIASGAVVRTISSDSIIDFDISAFNGSSTVRVNDLSLIQGTPSFTVTVSDDQSAGVYSLAGGAAGFTGTVSIGTDETDYGQLAVNGASLIYERHSFTLATVDSELRLTVNDVISGMALADSVYNVSAGVTVLQTYVGPGGGLNVYSGGSAINTMVDDGGYLGIGDGGTVTGFLQIGTGATVSAYSGSIVNFDISGFDGGSDALVNDLSLIHGTPAYTVTVAEDRTGEGYTQPAGVYTLAGGAAGFTGTVSIGTDGSNYGTLTVNGDTQYYNGDFYSLAVVDSELQLTVINGTVYGLSLVDSTYNVSSGYTVVDTSVGPGGGLNVYSGGSAVNTWVDDGGYLGIGDGGKVTGYLEIASGAVVSAYVGSIIDFNITNCDGYSDVLVNDISLIQGTPAYTVTVAENQASGIYILAGGADSFTGTVSIGTDGSNYGTLTVDGDALESGRYTFTLAVTEDYLLLSTAIIDNFDLGVVTSSSTVADASITTAGEIDRYRFTIQDNSFVSLETSGLFDNDTVMRLLDESMTEIAYNDDRDTDLYSWIGMNLGAGTYIAEVCAYGDSVISSYSFSVTVEPPKAEVLNITADITSFTSQSVTVTAEFNDITAVRQYSLDDETWLEYASGVVMSENGIVYFRGLDDHGLASEVQSYTVSNIIHPVDLGVITSSYEISDESINFPGETDCWSFTIAKPGFVTIETTGLIGDTVLQLLDGSMTQIAYDDDGGTGNFSLIGLDLNAGTYTVMVSAFGSSTIGNYSLSLTLDPAQSGTAGDLNADGRADIVMTIAQDGHPDDGSTGAWLIQNDQTAAWGDLSTRNPGWEIFGTGRTSAGKNTDDVYIKSTGNVVGAWTTGNDGKVTGWETIGEFDSNTQIIGLGDFNGNGQTDLLLRNTNGAVGCFFTGGETTGWNYFQSLGDEWKLSAIGDLNGDGRDDVVLKHDAGFTGSWLTQADGTMAWADLDTLQDGFEIVGAGDFNGDGTDDVLLQKGSYFGAWLVKDGSTVGWMGLGDLGSVTVEQITDFNGDGIDDLRIRTSAGDIGTQLVMGEDNLVWKYYGSVGSEWSTSLAALA